MDAQVEAVHHLVDLLVVMKGRGTGMTKVKQFISVRLSFEFILQCKWRYSEQFDLIVSTACERALLRGVASQLFRKFRRNSMNFAHTGHGIVSDLSCQCVRLALMRH